MLAMTSSVYNDEILHMTKDFFFFFFFFMQVYFVYKSKLELSSTFIPLQLFRYLRKIFTIPMLIPKSLLK